MATYTTDTGYGYFKDSDGKVVDKFAGLAPGEHELTGPRAEAVDVSGPSDLDSVELHPKYASGGEYPATLDEAKQEKVAEVKRQAKAVLGETDWYVIRKQETGESIPQAVLDHRSKVRSTSDSAETDVNDLTTIADVVTYTVNWPDPP